jgi:hypothetical protein
VTQITAAKRQSASLRFRAISASSDVKHSALESPWCGSPESSCARLKVWKRLFRAEPARHAIVLPGLVNSADSVCGIERIEPDQGFTRESEALVDASAEPIAAEHRSWGIGSPISTLVR